MDSTVLQKRYRLSRIFSITAASCYVILLVLVISMVVMAPLFAVLAFGAVIITFVFLLSCLLSLWFVFRSLKKNYSDAKFKLIIVLTLIPLFIVSWLALLL